MGFTLQVLGDGQVLEVYASNRWALATMIYTGVEQEFEGRAEAVATAFATCVDGHAEGNDQPAAVFEDVQVFEMVGEIVSTLGRIDHENKI